MIPADCPDHSEQFNILMNELEEFNPDLLHKTILLAISKSDMLDQELQEEIAKTLPEGIPHYFISSASGQGIVALKDALWEALNEEKQD
jgi:GTP-binding protein